VIERRRDVGRGEPFAVCGEGGFVVALSDDLSPFHAAAGHQHGHAARVVVAAARIAAVVDFRGAAEFSGDEDGGRIEQAALRQSGEQGRQTGVQRG
jgi:hypothetical protein